MPELPEVEVIRRDLEKEILGRTIRSVAVASTPNALRVIRRNPRPSKFVEALVARTIVRIDRQGKYLVFRLDNGSSLIAHLGMSGQLILAPCLLPMPKHTHIVLEFTSGGELRYVDPRTFGEMFVATAGDGGGIRELQRLGFDALQEPFPRRDFSDSLAVRRTKLKSLLMDQRFVCGLGNIYSDEILFRARLRHDRLSNTLSADEVRRLYEAIGQVLNDAIRHRGTSIEDEQYRDLYGSVGGFQHLLKVYQREGQPCSRCGTPIARARWSGRSTYYCPLCQA
ncbi:MAG: bifunctional DNA-formamidopyrimidine glycosylase/DNA-(apurinic or apyrimidinic site) lyase [Actinomycetota bacterium]|nr:bifunctional DNA-formamidopyrimidine glycosylase/DNA-(apurinic or apyrimidinic site) lyase [Actinomycetota bacterium]